jgi:heptaprenyl diphosphate synthase
MWMPLQNRENKTTKDLAVLAVLLACILVIGVLERMIPFDFAVPGVKLGLSNVAVLLALYLFDFQKSLLLVFLKCVLTAVIAGTPLSFLYSVCGAFLSFFVMWLFVCKGSNRISAVGISILGAVAHNIGQLIPATFFLGSFFVWYYLPALLLSGVITGLIVGLVVKYTLPYLQKHLL